MVTVIFSKRLDRKNTESNFLLNISIPFDKIQNERSVYKFRIAFKAIRGCMRE